MGDKSLTIPFLIPFLRVFHQNKALHNFSQKGAASNCWMHKRSRLGPARPHFNCRIVYEVNPIYIANIVIYFDLGVWDRETSLRSKLGPKDLPSHTPQTLDRIFTIRVSF